MVGGDVPDKLLGVRDGFRRYFNEGLETPVPVAVVAERLVTAESTLLPLTDEGILELARRRAQDLVEVHGERFGFCVGVEAGLLAFGGGETTGGEQNVRYFVRSWAVVKGLEDEAWGSSGSLQLPRALIDGLDASELPFVVPGRRRSGGMVSSLSGGLETRRSATALATFHAVASLMYSYLESHAHRHRR